MRNVLLILLLFNQISYAQTEADYIFKNVNVITMSNDKVLNKQNVVVKDGKIIEIAPKTKFKAKNVIDASGKFLMPSMADAHIHFPDSEAEFEKMLKLNLINGITKVRSMRGRWEDIQYRKKYNEPNSYYPRLYLSPPPTHKSHEFSEADLENYVKSANEYGFDFIKILSVKNPETLKQLAKLCEIYDVNFGGHFPHNKDDDGFETQLIFSKKFNFIEHLGGLIVDTGNYKKRVQLIKDNNVFICPTMQWYAIGYGQYGIEEMINQRGMEYIPKEIVTDWAEKSRQYREKLGTEGFEEERRKYAQEMQERYKIVKRLNDDGVKLLLSPDASSKFIVFGFGLLEEMKLYQAAGLSNFDILKSATVNYALLFNENYGSIEKGKDADFILLNENPIQNLNALENVEAVFINSQFLDKEQLNAISNSILP